MVQAAATPIDVQSGTLLTLAMVAMAMGGAGLVRALEARVRMQPHSAEP